MTDKIFKSKKVDETAAAGSTAGGSIATVPSRMGDMQRRISLKDFMTDFYKRVANRAYFTPVTMESSIKGITESTEHPFQMNDVVSRLKGMESQGRYSTVDSITFGVEDDAKNIMKVTIPKEQAEAFELAVARALADVIEFKKTGVGENRTLAQLLYDLNGQFTIINAEFPKIPSEAVYNADEISRMPDDAIGEQEDQDIGMDDPEGEESPTDDPEGDIEGEPEETPEDEEDLDDMDDETVSGFEDEGEESLLRSVLAMLKAQSEKEIAQANAEAEKAKARQAELAHEASMKRLETEEEILQAEAEMEAEKEKEKEAKRLADLAKFKYTRKATREGFSDTFVKALFEISDMDSVQSKRMQLRALRQKWQPDPEDSPETRRYKQQQLQNAIRINRLEQQAVRTRDEYEQEKAERERQEQEQERQEQQMPDRETGPEAGAEQGRM